MFSNISPYVCSNTDEFLDERNCLREVTFPKLEYELGKLNINFDPFDLYWTENDDCAKSGQLLRLLLHNIQQSSPFFICLLGHQYGPHLNDTHRSSSTRRSSLKSRSANSWVDRNLKTASQTGYYHLVNQFTSQHSFLEHQINAALQNEENYPYYRFYYRQVEFLESKFEHLPISEQKEAFALYDAEDEYCDEKMKEIKLKIAKKGIVIKYYSSLEQLHEYIYEDLIELVQGFLKIKLKSHKSRSDWSIDVLQAHKLKNFVLTESLQKLLMNLDAFCHKEAVSVKFADSEKSSTRTDETSSGLTSHEKEQIAEYREILRLRHQKSILKKNDSSKVGENSSKNIFLIHGPRGKGKTSLMLYIYKNLETSGYQSIFEPQSIPNTRSMSSRPMSSKSSKSAIRATYATGSKSASVSSTNKSKEIQPLYLFYFLKPEDLLITVLVDIICKMRLKFTKKDSSWSLNNELYDTNSVVEQFHAALRLGPSIIFIDGIMENESETQPIKLNHWLPTVNDTKSKFVITSRRATKLFAELSNYRSATFNELNIFEGEGDYHNTFAKLLNAQRPHSKGLDQNNVLYLKYKHLFNLNMFSISNHASNPLFVQLIAKELFCFDNVIYKSHPMFHRKSTASTMNSDATEGSSFNFKANNDNHVIESYFEDVLTIRELIQKIIARYLMKKYNWPVKTKAGHPLTKKNSGWVGETLCLIALSVHGIKKRTILNILKTTKQIQLTITYTIIKVNELNWQLFRMQFGFFIYEDFNGMLKFSHDYFREAVQTLLLDGLNVTTESQSDPNLPPCKQNISETQRQLHIAIIVEMLQNQFKKDEFDFSSQIDNKNEYESSEYSQHYLILLHELIHHLYMIYDLVNLCKFLTNFKVLHIFHENRTRHLFEWFDFCNYLKLTTNLNVVRIILLSSFTIGMPQYEIVMRDDNLYFKLITNDQQSEMTAESQTIPRDLMDDSTLNKKLNFKENLMDNLSQSVSSFQNKSNTSIGAAAEQYESYIDTLLDLSDIIDLTENEFGDTVNLILTNRALILIDLMKNLEDKYFMECLAFKLGKLIDNIVTQNYPLNNLEKLKYTQLLETLANISIQLNDYESALRFFIKSIEILDDLYTGFHLVELNKKYKNRLQLHQISNRLSILHSNMALLLLKMNNLSAANAVLSKANRFSLEAGGGATANLELEAMIKEKTIEHDTEMRIRADRTQLIEQEALEDKLKKSFRKTKQLKYEDASVMDAKFSYFFISGLYEIQSGNFHNANTFFHNALNLTLRWFGPNHLNTSKIYHYYGCFYSLQDMNFFNPRRAELFLRKALFIRELFKESPTAIYKLKNNFVSHVSTSLISAADDNLPIQSERTTDRSTGGPAITSRTKATTFTEATTSEPKTKRVFRNEEQNSIAEILFDLGCLLSTFDSHISKKEAIDYIRRALDIKVLLFGPNHNDCSIINSKLNESLLDYNNSVQQKNRPVTSRLGTPVSRAASRVASAPLKALEVSPRSKLKRYLQDLKKCESLDNRELEVWIAKNSVIEKIPSKLDRAIMNSPVENTRRNEQSFDEQFMRSFDINDESNNTRGTLNREYDSQRTSRNNSVINEDGQEEDKANTRIGLERSKSFHGRESPRKLQRAKTSIHSLKCKCPTALSVDIHNTRTVTAGPHSSIQNLLNPSVINTNDRIKMNMAPPNVHNKIYKHIYYKSVWYDLPAGSSMRRYKNYIKVTPNA